MWEVTCTKVSSWRTGCGQAVKPLIETIDRLGEEVKELEKILAQKVCEDRVVELLMTIPGTGLITAATVRAFVWFMLKKNEPVDPIQMTDPAIQRTASEMRAAIDAA